ncbi:hypothetical protein DCC81_17490 [Chitinophaga parva]|uniref:Lipoprotein n=1 Tax=Chitinophaga parva TaxID=2169414 RepID=A0A2T7BIC2_9BACT|nr:hypothetical protein [Chitinophaga parva]PUZ26036.1 hypothetical protein DCC81_17490 [Chitinophaga parva]
MKKYILLFVTGLVFFTACNTATPANYFDYAVLNTNMLDGFENDGLMREMVHPSAKLKEGTKDQTEIMKRKEIVDNKIQYVEQSLEKVKGLKPTDETRDMLAASEALYTYVIPVYKNEYTKMAEAWDNGASPEQVAAMGQAIHDKYGEGYRQRFDKLIALGKAYADKHNIQVQWGNN